MSQDLPTQHDALQISESTQDIDLVSLLERYHPVAERTISYLGYMDTLQLILTSKALNNNPELHIARKKQLQQISKSTQDLIATIVSARNTPAIAKYVTLLFKETHWFVNVAKYIADSKSSALYRKNVYKLLSSLALIINEEEIYDHQQTDQIKMLSDAFVKSLSEREVEDLIQHNVTNDWLTTVLCDLVKRLIPLPHTQSSTMRQIISRILNCDNHNIMNNDTYELYCAILENRHTRKHALELLIKLDFQQYDIIPFITLFTDEQLRKVLKHLEPDEAVILSETIKSNLQHDDIKSAQHQYDIIMEHITVHEPELRQIAEKILSTKNTLQELKREKTALQDEFKKKRQEFEKERSTYEQELRCIKARQTECNQEIATQQNLNMTILKNIKAKAAAMAFATTQGLPSASNIDSQQCSSGQQPALQHIKQEGSERLSVGNLHDAQRRSQSKEQSAISKRPAPAKPQPRTAATQCDMK